MIDIGSTIDGSLRKMLRKLELSNNSAWKMWIFGYVNTSRDIDPVQDVITLLDKRTFLS
jgi:CBS domain-containing protein